MRDHISINRPNVIKSGPRNASLNNFANVRSSVSRPKTADKNSISHASPVNNHSSSDPLRMSDNCLLMSSVSSLSVPVTPRYRTGRTIHFADELDGGSPLANIYEVESYKSIYRDSKEVECGFCVIL
eukprot:GHVL01022963.1.p1 GENE.GHVL01022963.1~~GHVL01022963.1.p1  ORF type:complete len:127 (+),score=7.98 GHVL01022963.1:127-507(+)